MPARPHNGRGSLNSLKNVSWQCKLYSWVRKDRIIRSIRCVGISNKLQCNSWWESPEMIPHSPSLSIWFNHSIKCTCWFPSISQWKSKMILWAAPAVEATARPPHVCESLGLKGWWLTSLGSDSWSSWCLAVLIHLKVLWGRILLNRVHQHYWRPRLVIYNSQILFSFQIIIYFNNLESVVHRNLFIASIDSPKFQPNSSHEYKRV